MSVVAPKSTTRPEEVPTLHRSSLSKGDSDYGDEKESPDAKAALNHDQEMRSVDSHPNVNGEPIITTGEDVSNFLVDVHDIGGNALTLRSLVLGSLLSAFGAAVTQVGAPRRQSPAHSLNLCSDLLVQARQRWREQYLPPSRYLLLWSALGAPSDEGVLREAPGHRAGC